MTQDERLNTLKEQAYNTYNKYFNDINKLFDDFAEQYESNTGKAVKDNEYFMSIYKLIFLSTSFGGIRAITRQVKDDAREKTFKRIIAELKTLNKKYEDMYSEREEYNEELD